MATDAPAATDSAQVQAFVGNAHGDLEAVRAALVAEPRLANAAWDWGGGDWETALGAAAHMGRRDIAELLLEHGARLDIFAAAMLGDVDVVRAKSSPLIRSCGTRPVRTASRCGRMWRRAASRRGPSSSSSTISR